MKKVLAVIGSPRKGQTYKAVQLFERKLKEHGNIDFEYLMLRDYDLKTCTGCFNCLTRGEDFCPLIDHRDVIFEKMKTADGVIFATPNYALQVTGILKNFLDRFAYICHRPCFFNKTSMAIVTQGIYGGKDIVKYLDSLAEFLGFRITKGVVITAFLGAKLPAEQKKIEAQMTTAAAGFYKNLTSEKMPSPSLKRLFIFRGSRNSIKMQADKSGADYNYFKNHGWFESDFYYEVKLNPVQKLAGKFIDWFVTREAEKGQRQREEYRAATDMAQ